MYPITAGGVSLELAAGIRRRGGGGGMGRSGPRQGSPQRGGVSMVTSHGSIRQLAGLDGFGYHNRFLDTGPLHHTTHAVKTRPRAFWRVFFADRASTHTNYGIPIDVVY